MLLHLIEGERIGVRGNVYKLDPWILERTIDNSETRKVRSVLAEICVILSLSWVVDVPGGCWTFGESASQNSVPVNT